MSAGACADDVAPGSGVARGTLLNLLGQGVPILVGLGAIPVIVRGFGAERFGLLALAWAALGYFGALDLGLSRSTTRLVADALGRHDAAAVPRIARTSFVLHAAVGLFGGIVIALAVPAIVGRAFRVPAALAADARAAFYILAASVPIVVGSAVFRGILEAHRRFAQVNAVKVVTGAASYLLPAIAVALGATVPVVVALLACVRLAAGLAYARLCRSIVGRPRSGAGFHGESAAALVSFGGWVMVTNLLASTAAYLDRAIISAVVSLAAVGYYTAPYEMVARLWILPSSLALALFPTVSGLGAAMSERAPFLFARSMKMTLVTMAPLVLLLAAFAEPVLQVWLGRVFATESTRVLQVLAVGVLFGSLGHVASEVLHAIGRPDLPAKLAVVEVPLYAVLAWWLTARLGIIGTALALMCRIVLDAGALFVLAALQMPRAAGNDIGEAIRPAALLALVFAGLLLGATWWGQALVVRVAIGACATAAFAWVAWSHVLDARDREALKAALLVGVPGRSEA
jgi:O-antigen/teichoic acid export membrane protein